MNIFKTLILVALFSLGAVSAQAVDPECQGVTQAPTLDYSDGNGALCTSQTLEDGTVISDTKVLDCTVTLLDEAGVEIGQVNITGGPGTFHSFAVPRDGAGSGVAVCSLDGLTSNAADGTVAVIFPIGAAPSAPITLP